jgi:hypothetical protein
MLLKFIPLFALFRDFLQLKLKSSSNVSILYYHYDVQYIAIVTQVGFLLNYLFILFVSQLSLTALNNFITIDKKKLLFLCYFRCVEKHRCSAV